MLGHRSDACREFAGFSFFVWGFNGESLAFRRQVLKLRLPGLSTRAGSRVIRTATDSDYRVHSYALDNYCGTSAPVSEGLLRHHLRTARPRQAEAKNHVPHVDLPVSPPLPPCDYDVTGCCSSSGAVGNPYEYTSDVCVRSLNLQHSRCYCLRTWRTETITATDMLQQWHPPTCLWYPPTASEGRCHRSCPSCRTHRSLCTL